MGSYCIAYGCKRRGGHRLPKDPVLRKAWLARIRREDTFQPSEHSRVCHAHFVKEDYVTTTCFGEYLIQACIQDLAQGGATNRCPEARSPICPQSKIKRCRFHSLFCSWAAGTFTLLFLVTAQKISCLITSFFLHFFIKIFATPTPNKIWCDKVLCGKNTVKVKGTSLHYTNICIFCNGSTKLMWQLWMHQCLWW